MRPQSAEKPWPINSVGPALLLALLFALCHGAQGLEKALESVGTGEPFRVIDFVSFHYAADSTFNRVLSPYSTATIDLYADQLGYRVYPFIYPPYALPFLYPLSFFDYQTGASISFVVNTLLAGVLFFVLHRMFLVHLQSRVAQLSILLFAMAFGSVEDTIHLGQVNLAAVIALLAAWQLLRQNRNPYAAGVLIGIAVIVKTYFGLFLLMLLLRRQYRSAIGALATVLAGSFLSVVVLPVELWSQWAEVAATRGGFGHMPFPEFPPVAIWNESINGITTRIFGPGQTAGATAAALATLVMAVSTWRLWDSRELDAIDFYDGGFVLLSCALFLVAPLSWIHHLVFLIGPMMCLWSRGEVVKSGRIVATGFFTIAALMAVQWPLGLLYQLWPPIASLPFLAVLLLWVLCLSRAALPWKSPSGLAYAYRHRVAGRGIEPRRAGRPERGRTDMTDFVRQEPLSGSPR